MTQNNIIAKLDAVDAEINKRVSEQYPFFIRRGWNADDYYGRLVLNYRGIQDSSVRFSFIVPLQYDSNHKFDFRVKCLLANDGEESFDGGLTHYDGLTASGIVQWDLSLAKITDGTLVSNMYNLGPVNTLQITFTEPNKVETGILSISVSDLGNPSGGDMMILDVNRNIASGTTTKSVQLVSIEVLEGDIY